MAKAVDITRVKWVAINGSVFTEQEVERTSDFGKKYKARLSIAFNIGDKLAKHIVNQHNDALEVIEHYRTQNQQLLEQAAV